MKVTLILYGSEKQYSAGHRPVHWAGFPQYYVRAEKSPFELSQALDKARPKPGETVLNTVEVDCGNEVKRLRAACGERKQVDK